MKLKLTLLFMGIALFITACSSPRELPSVTHVRQMGPTPVSEGFFYTLPRTIVTVDIEITRTEKTPGPFAEYAGRYLGLDDVLINPSVNYDISLVNINSFSEPDPDQVYFVPFEAVADQAFFVSLSESGLIQSLNVPFDNVEFMKRLSETQQYGFFGSDITFNHFIDINLQEKIDTIFEKVRVDTMTLERQTLRRSWVEKSTDIRAREVADFIIQIRDKKFDLISGFAEIPYSKEALEYMYSEMSALENDYLKLFTGITSESTINYRYTLIPDAAAREKPVTLFRFSPREGVLDERRQDGYAVSLVMLPGKSTQSIPLIARPVPGAEDQTQGVFYRIPEYTTLELREGNIVRSESRFLVNQFGVVSRMAPRGMAMEFYPHTGSVKSVGNINIKETEN